ncbi:glycoside hydrolase family 43 protein, partial [Micromonosporaceae bacterium Da 78-11]
MRRRTPWRRALATTLATVLLTAGGSSLVSPAARAAAPTPAAVPAQAAAAPAGTFRNPVSTAADPFITYTAGQYYLIESGGDNTVRMRHAPSLGRLLASPAQAIWTETDPSRNRDIWAPVFVNLADHWYVYYAADNGDIGNHRMQVLESDATVSAGATPLGPYHHRATLQDPSSGYFGIDGVPFTHNGALYFVWAAGYCCGFDRLRIAPMANPYTLTGTSYEMPVDICDAVAEAPATLHRNGRTFLTYSICDTGKPDYQLKMLSIADGADPMTAGNWRDHGTVFARNNAAGTYSVGSNGFFTSPDGTQDWIAYQAKNTAANGDNTYAGRDTRVQPFGWNADGTPNFGTPVGAGDNLALPGGDPGPAPTVINNSDTGGGASS